MNYQIAVMTELLVVSVCMFTLPFVSYFGTQRVIKDYYPLLVDSEWDFYLPIVAAVVTVWIIISLYIIRALNDPENYTVEENEKKE